MLHPMAQVSMICENKVYNHVVVSLHHFSSSSSKFRANSKSFPPRIADQPKNRPCPFVFQPNAPVTTVITRFGIAASATVIVTIVDVAAITLCTEVCRRPGKWTPKCKPIWWKRLLVCCAKQNRLPSNRAVIRRINVRIRTICRKTISRWTNVSCSVDTAFGFWLAVVRQHRTPLSRHWVAYCRCCSIGSTLRPTRMTVQLRVPWKSSRSNTYADGSRTSVRATTMNS